MNITVTTSVKSVFLIFTLFLIKGCLLTDGGRCSTYIKSIEKEAPGVSVFHFSNISTKSKNSTIEVHFSGGVENNKVESELFTSTDWNFKANPNITINPLTNTRDISVVANYSKKEDVKKILVDMVDVCGQQEETYMFPSSCPTDFNISKNVAVINIKGTWRSGRNYRIAIPVIGNFSSYALHMHFTEPVTYMTMTHPKNPPKVSMLNSTHWVVKKESPEHACIKLIVFQMEMGFTKKSDIKALILNVQPIDESEDMQEVYRNKFDEREDGRCSLYIKSTENETPEVSVFHLTNLFPNSENGSIQVFFTEPMIPLEQSKICNVELPAPSSLLYWVNSSQMVSESSFLSHGNASERPNVTQNPFTNASEISFKANYTKKADIKEIQVDGMNVCVPIEEINNLVSICPTDIDIKMDEVIKEKAVWPTGKNYSVSIMALGNFYGYAVDIFFTMPVNNIATTRSDIGLIMVNSTHWVIVKQSTEQACVKLVNFNLQLSYTEKSDIDSLIFNGDIIIPGRSHSQAVFRSESYEDGKSMDCERYFKKRAEPWDGVDSARALWFSAQLDQNTVGIVIYFIFEQEVRNVELGSLRTTKVSDTIWRMENPGWIVTTDDLTCFGVTIHFYQHYHVKIKGIMANGKILCGLGTEYSYETEDNNDLSQEFTNIPIQQSNLKIEVGLMILSLVLTLLIIVSSGIIFPILMIRKLKKSASLTANNYKAIYDSRSSGIYAEIIPSSTYSTSM